MVSGIIAKYAKMVRTLDAQIVALTADYFHEDAIRCTYSIFIEKKEIIHLIGPCAEKNGDRKIEGCSFSEVMASVFSSLEQKFGKQDYGAEIVDISEDEFVHLVQQYGFTENLLKEIRETATTRSDTSVFDFATNTFRSLL